MLCPLKNRLAQGMRSRLLFPLDHSDSLPKLQERQRDLEHIPQMRWPSASFHVSAAAM